VARAPELNLYYHCTTYPFTLSPLHPMPELTDIFPTAVYETNGYLICPNGDKLRSDAEGLFCWIEGDTSSGRAGQRVPATVVNGQVQLLPAAAPAAAPAAKSKKAEVADANG